MLAAISAVMSHRILYIPPEKPHRAFIFARDALGNVARSNYDILEINLSNGSIIKRIPAPPALANSDIKLGRGNAFSISGSEYTIGPPTRPIQVFLYADQSDHPWIMYEIDIGRTIREGIYMYNDRLYVLSDLERHIIRLQTFQLPQTEDASRAVLTPISNTRMKIPAILDGYWNEFPKTVIGDKFWVISVCDSDGNGHCGDGSHIFLAQFGSASGGFVNCAPDPDSGLFPGPRYKYAHAFHGNRLYLAGGSRGIGAVPFDCWELTLPDPEDTVSLPTWRRLPLQLRCTSLYSTLAMSYEGVLYAIQPNTFLDSMLSSAASNQGTENCLYPWRRISTGPYASMICLGYTRPPSLSHLASMAMMRSFPGLEKKSSIELKEGGFPNYMINLYT